MKTVLLMIAALLVGCGGGDPEIDYGSTRPCVYAPPIPGCANPDDLTYIP